MSNAAYNFWGKVYFVLLLSLLLFVFTITFNHFIVNEITLLISFENILTLNF